MTFTKRKSASKDVADKPKKLRVVSVRLTEEEYQQVVENCRKAGRKLSDFWRRALLNVKITALATPEDMAILRQIGSMSNNLNQLATVAYATKDFKLVSWEVQARSKELKTLYNNLSNDWKHN